MVTACSTVNDIFLAGTILGGVALIVGMILGYFRWFYTKTDEGQSARGSYR